MDKRNIVINIAIVIFLGILLLGIGVVIGRFLLEPEIIAVNSEGQQLAIAGESTEHDTITVTGQALFKLSPEIAIIVFGIEVCNRNALAANKTINENLSNVETALKEIGLEDSEIVATDFSMYPRYDYDSYGEDVTEFCGSNRLTVTTKKLNLVSNILDTAIGAGATNVYGVSFTQQNIESASQAGIQEAFKDAEEQAKILAQSMDSKLDGIESSTVTINGYLLSNGYYGGGGGVDPQEGDLTVQVEVVYKITR